MAWRKSLIAGVATSLTALAEAHTHLSGSVPAEGSTVQAPEQIALTFSEAARVTALTIRRESEPEQKLSPLPSATTREVRVPAPKLPPGRYTVSWRVLSEDGHVMSGTLHFSVAAASADGSTGHVQ